MSATEVPEIVQLVFNMELLAISSMCEIGSEHKVCLGAFFFGTLPLHSCESDIAGTAKHVSFCESESDILKFRFRSDVKCLCEPQEIQRLVQQEVQ